MAVMRHNKVFFVSLVISAIVLSGCGSSVTLSGNGVSDNVDVGNIHVVVNDNGNGINRENAYAYVEDDKMYVYLCADQPYKEEGEYPKTGEEFVSALDMDMWTYDLYELAPANGFLAIGNDAGQDDGGRNYAAAVMVYLPYEANNPEEWTYMLCLYNYGGQIPAKAEELYKSLLRQILDLSGDRDADEDILKEDFEVLKKSTVDTYEIKFANKETKTDAEKP